MAHDAGLAPRLARDAGPFISARRNQQIQRLEGLAPADSSNRRQPMPERSTETTVTFKHPFMLGSFDVMQPAGTYRLVIDEEEILGLSFPAYRRTSTVLHVPAGSKTSGSGQAFPVDAAELDAALEADARGLPTGSSQS
jgi:hypothetical protein